ncbi:hypothetical protein LTR39_003922, partial [Cryomyces antarcticus]
MTTVSMNCISFYQPPTSTALYRDNCKASSYRKGRSIRAASSKPSETIQCNVADWEIDCVDNDETDDDLPALEEILQRPSHRHISITELPDPQRIRYPHKATLNAKSSSMPHDQVQPKLGNDWGDSQGRPVLEDDEPESTATVAKADSVDVSAGNATQNTGPSDILTNLDQTLKPSKPADPSDPTRWYDVGDECFICDEPTSGPTLAEAIRQTYTTTQDKLLHHSSQPSQDQDRSGRITRYASEEPVAPQSLLKSLGEDGEGWSGNITEMERELMQALQVQALKLQAAAAQEIAATAS